MYGYINTKVTGSAVKTDQMWSERGFNLHLSSNTWAERCQSGVTGRTRTLEASSSDRNQRLEGRFWGQDDWQLLSRMQGPPMAGADPPAGQLCTPSSPTTSEPSEQYRVPVQSNVSVSHKQLIEMMS